jgi:uncharacterized protein
MLKQTLWVGTIPAILWGPPSDKAYIFVHGRMSRKEDAEGFADIAEAKGYQVISFDLPEHGERKTEDYPCTVQNAVQDLHKVEDYARHSWRQLSLFASSLGAFFSLIAYPDAPFGKCLFLSPILDMEILIQNMMQKAAVTEELLMERLEIITPAGEILSWAYYSFVKENPVVKWNSRTYILYGARDELTSRRIVDTFVANFQCSLEVVPDGEHYFHTSKQKKALGKWLNLNI